MFEKGLNPNLPATIFVHTVLFTAGFFLLESLNTLPFKWALLFLLFAVSFLGGLSPAVPAILSGVMSGKTYGTLQTIFLNAIWLTITFYLTRQKGITWAIRLRKKHEKFYLFAQEHFKNGFVWAFRNRIIQLIPEDDFNLGTGKSSVRFISYLIGSLLGMIPQFWILACWGNALNVFIQKPDLHHFTAFGIWGILALFCLSVPAFYRHMECWGSEQ